MDDQDEFLSQFVEDSQGETEVYDGPPKEPRPNRGRPLPPKETRWKKGVSGNPRGRPKKRDSLTDLIGEMLRKKCRTDREKRTWGELFVQALLHSALKGNATASKLILERHDGKNAQTENRSGENDRDRKKPAQRGLSKESMNAIRDIYGLPHVEEEEEEEENENSQKDREPGKESHPDTDDY